MIYIFLMLPFFFMYPSVKAMVLDHEGKFFMMASFLLCCLGAALYLLLITTSIDYPKELIVIPYVLFCLLLLFKRKVIFDESIWWRSNPSNIFEWLIAFVSLAGIIAFVILMVLSL